MASTALTFTGTIMGERVSLSRTRTEDGVAGVTPTGPAAVAGTLTTRDANDEGSITAAGHGLVETDLAVLTWLDVDGITYKHRYNVQVTSVVGNIIGFLGGAGDNLPAATTAIKVAYQKKSTLIFDFDTADTVVIAANNCRGVIVLCDAGDAVLLEYDLSPKGMVLWTREDGVAQLSTGNPVAYAIVGSGTAGTAFEPTIAAMYDSTPGSGQG